MNANTKNKRSQEEFDSRAIESFLATKRNIVDKGEKFIFDCDCKQDRTKNKGKGVLWKNDPRKWYCSHNQTGWETGIKRQAKDKAEYFVNHGLDPAWLKDQGYIDENFAVIVGNARKNLMMQREGKFVFSSKGITKEKNGAIYPPVGNGDRLFIFAGDADRLKAIQDGLACTSPIFGEGCNLFDCEKALAALGNYREIVFCYDNDKAGREGREKNIHKLLPLLPAARLGFIELPSTWGVKDFCDYRGRNSLEAFKALPIVYQAKKPDKAAAEPETIPLDSPASKKDIELPIEEIHPFFARYWRNLEGKTEAPKEYVLSALLTCLGAAIGNKATLKLGHGIKANLYCCLLGDSTFMRKTTSIDYAKKPLALLSEERKQEYLAELARWEKDCENYSLLSKKDRSQRENPAKKPPRDRSLIYANDLTPEKLLEKMSHKPDGIFIYSELGSLLAKLNVPYMAGFKENLTDFYDGRTDIPFRRETKKGGLVEIKDPAPSLLAASTFQWVQAHLKASDLLSGFLARFVFVCRRNYPAIDVALPAWFDLDKEWIEYFRKIEEFNYSLQLDEGAKEAYSDWYAREKARAIGQDVLTHGFLGRLLVTCHKVAIINHVLRYVDSYQNHLVVSPDRLQAEDYSLAFPWIAFFIENILDCYSELVESTDLNELKLLEIIRKKGERQGEYIQCPQSKIGQYGHMRKKELLETLETLELKNLVRRFTRGQKGVYTLWGIPAEQKPKR